MFYVCSDEILDEFKKACPWIVDELYSWENVDDYEILVELKNGSVIGYDYILKVFRGARSKKDWFDKLQPKNEKEWRNLFSIRLYRLMLLSGLTQDELAYRAGLSTSTMSKYVNGLVTPSAWKLTKLANAMGCSLADIITFDKK